MTLKNTNNHTVIGMCCYSMENLWGQRVKVFDEPYFSKRLSLFENITLRSLDAQTEKNFVLLIYHSDKCPADKRLIFKKLADKHPYLVNVFIKGAKMTVPAKYQATPLFTFRLDNDDGFPNDFIARLNQAYHKLSQQKAPDTVITCPPIFKVGKLGEDKFLVKKGDFYSNSIGITLYSHTKTTMRDLGNHAKVNERFPMEVMPGQGGLQILHDSNVMNGVNGFSGKEVDGKELLNLLAELGYPPIDLAKLPLYEKR